MLRFHKINQQQSITSHRAWRFKWVEPISVGKFCKFFFFFFENVDKNEQIKAFNSPFFKVSGSRLVPQILVCTSILKAYNNSFQSSLTWAAWCDFVPYFPVLILPTADVLVRWMEPFWDFDLDLNCCHSNDLECHYCTVSRAFVSMPVSNCSLFVT